jgi:multidrug efflux pump subunit AcrB
MRIWLDPERLAKLGLTASDVIAAVREQNVQIAAGRAGSPPAPEGVQLELPLRTEGRLSTVEDFEQIVTAPSRADRCCTSATWRASSSARRAMPRSRA